MDRDDWRTWNKVFLKNKELLPEYSGIYIVADRTDFVLYVGKSKNIKSRWNGHHRHRQLIRNDRRLYIYFNRFSVDELDRKERYYSHPAIRLLKMEKLK